MNITALALAAAAALIVVGLGGPASADEDVLIGGVVEVVGAAPVAVTSTAYENVRVHTGISNPDGVRILSTSVRIRGGGGEGGVRLAPGEYTAVTTVRFQRWWERDWKTFNCRADAEWPTEMTWAENEGTDYAGPYLGWGELYQRPWNWRQDADAADWDMSLRDAARYREGVWYRTTETWDIGYTWNEGRGAWCTDPYSPELHHAEGYQGAQVRTFRTTFRVRAVMSPREYRRVQVGMGVDRVAGIIGDAGQVTRRYAVGQVRYVWRTWVRAGAGEGEARVLFVNGTTRAKIWK